MASIRQFEDLRVWQKARELTKWVYTVTGHGALAKDFGLRDQMRRSAISVMSNLAEGFERGGNKEFRQFLSTAKASIAELKSQLYIAQDAGFLSEAETGVAMSMCNEIARMSAGLMRYLARSTMRGSKSKLGVN